MFLHGGGHSIRSFIHINDVVDATLKLMVEANPGNYMAFVNKRIN